MLTIGKFMRRSFPVDGVQVTPENIHDVAKWCEGSVRTARGGEKYVKVRVLRPLSPRQTQAFIGDWVLYAGTGYKVYTDRAFKGSFEAAPDNPYPDDAGVVIETPQNA